MTAYVMHFGSQCQSLAGKTRTTIISEKQDEGEIIILYNKMCACVIVQNNITAWNNVTDTHMLAHVGFLLVGWLI